MYGPTPKWPPAIAPDAAKSRPHPYPEACVLRNPNERRPTYTFCGRLIGDKEFAFENRDHAFRHYVNVKGPGLRACPECHAVYLAERPRQEDEP